MNLSNLYPIKSKAIIYKSELEYISRCVLDYPSTETGGDLFGFWTHSRYPVIQYVTGPGPNSNHQLTFFNQDANYLAAIGNKLRETHGLQHIGEWHSHHQLGLAEPSGHDISTVCNAISEYKLTNFFLVIANIKDSSSSINGFMFHHEKKNDFDYTGWVILEGDSPIRGVFDHEFLQMVYAPKTDQPSLIDLPKVSLDNLEFYKPEYSTGYWLSDKSNQHILKNLVETLSKTFTNIQIFQKNEDKTIYLEFNYGKNEIVIFFPLKFPNIRPILMDKKENKIIENTWWDYNGDILIATLNCIIYSMEVYAYNFSEIININK